MRCYVHKSFVPVVQLLTLIAAVAGTLSNEVESHEPYDALPEFSKRDIAQRYQTYWKVTNDSHAIHTKQSDNQFCRDNRKEIQCNARTPFSTLDGTCNNLRNPYWGASYTTFQRVARPDYADGRGSPRGSNGRLPLARVVSTTIHPDRLREAQNLNLAFPIFGQFLVHDIVQGFLDDITLQCCDRHKDDPRCMQVVIPENDEFYSQHGVRCIGLQRAVEYCVPNSDNVREQINLVTSYLDMSHVYGNNPERARQLRSGQGGRLAANPDLPNMCPSISQLSSRYGEREWAMDFDYFASGDMRTNENPMLSSWHVLFFREHNKLVADVQNRRPRMGDQGLYLHTRRILTAIFQNIVYNEYLPILVGGRNMRRFRLSVNRDSRYHEDVNPMAIHAFSTAAFRFGHGLMGSSVTLVKDRDFAGRFTLRDELLSARQVRNDNGEGFHRVLNGQLNQSPQAHDRFVTEDLTRFLFMGNGSRFGEDLVSRNIQRARDHGVPSYNAYRRFCRLPRLTRSWEDRPEEIKGEDWERFKSIYSSPYDIDLFPAGLVEQPEDGALVGPTFACIISRQFHDLKFGDRFFFTHSNTRTSFTEEQMEEIRKVTLAHIICRNLDVSSVPRDTFRPGNTVSCDQLNRRYLDLSEFL